MCGYAQPQARLPNGAKIRFGHILLAQMHTLGMAFDVIDE
jgi:hypothetical protein